MSTTSTITAPPFDFDPLSPAFQRQDPFETYRRLRDEAPVYYSEKWNWWALSRFEDVRTAVLDPATYQSFEGIDIDDTAKDQSGPGFLPDIDNPRHDQIRRVIQPYFLPRRINEQKQSVQRVVRGLVDGWRTRGSVDLASELSWPMPNEVFFRVLGLPYSLDEGEGGAAQLLAWVHELKDRAPHDIRLTPVAKAATRGIQDYFVELLQDRRRHPRNDLVSFLVQADIDGTPFADEDIVPASEIMGLMMVLFLGGVESTAGLTSTAFKLLAENPDQRDLVLADPALIPDAVEETLRFATPLQLAGRTTSREVELHGVTIPAGGRVVLLYGAANRDERQYPDPDRFDVRRERGRHLGFSEGMHGCLGAPLARLEVQTALEEALPVLGRFELAGRPERYATTPNMYVWSSLPLRFDVEAAAPRPDPTPLGTPPDLAASSFDDVPQELDIRVRVRAKDLVADGVAALTLTAVDGGALPPWRPGAHLDLVLGAAPTRQYSLCGRVDDTGSFRIGILRDDQGSGGSRYVHETLRAGDEVRIRGPRNHFALEPSPAYVFVAGGIGITPMLPMIAAAEAAGATWELLYGGRTRTSMAFLDELSEHGDRVTVWPQDEVGLLDLEAVLGTPRADTLVYACGPEPLLAAVEQRCTSWSPGALHLERFTPKPMGAPVRAEAFDVVLERSGLTLRVPPDRSVMSVVEEAGVTVVSSCAEGTCGTCETRVVDGLPDHRDSVLREDERAENTCMMICVSRSCGDRLVLDL